MKSAFVLDWALNTHSSSDDIIFMGYKSGHTPHCYTEKNETPPLFTSCQDDISPQLTVCAVLPTVASCFLLWRTFQGVFKRLHHIFPLCSDVRVSLHSDYLFRLKNFQTLMTV